MKPRLRALAVKPERFACRRQSRNMRRSLPRRLITPRTKTCPRGPRPTCPMKQLAVRRVAQVVVCVSVLLMQRKRPHHNRQRLHRLNTVRGPAFARHDALDIRLHRQRHRHHQFALARRDADRIVQRERLAVCAQGDGAVQKNRLNLAFALGAHPISLRAHLQKLLERRLSAICTQPETCAGFPRRGNRNLLVVPEGPQPHVQCCGNTRCRLRRSSIGSCDRDCGQQNSVRNKLHGFAWLNGEWARSSAATWAASLPFPVGR